MARLAAGEIEADDAVTDEAAGDLRQRQVLRRWHIPQRRDDDPTLETESLPAGGPAAQHGAEDVRERETLLHVQPGPVANFSISNVVVLQVFGELVGGALERRHGLQHRDR